MSTYRTNGESAYRLLLVFFGSNLKNGLPNPDRLRAAVKKLVSRSSRQLSFINVCKIFHRSLNFIGIKKLEALDRIGPCSMVSSGSSQFQASFSTILKTLTPRNLVELNSKPTPFAGQFSHGCEAMRIIRKGRQLGI